MSRKPCASCAAPEKWISLNSGQANWLQPTDFVQEFFKEPTGFFVTVPVPAEPGWLWLSAPLQSTFSEVPHAREAYMGNPKGHSIQRVMRLEGHTQPFNIRIRAPVPYCDTSEDGTNLHGQEYAPHAHFRYDNKPKEGSQIITFPFLVPVCGYKTAGEIANNTKWETISIKDKIPSPDTVQPKTPILLYGTSDLSTLKQVAKAWMQTHSLVCVYNGEDLTPSQKTTIKTVPSTPASVEDKTNQSAEVKTDTTKAATKDMQQPSEKQSGEKPEFTLAGGQTGPSLTLHQLKKHVQSQRPTHHNKVMYNQLVQEMGFPDRHRPITELNTEGVGSAVQRWLKEYTQSI